ncbi:WYL domain-containing protein [bacterium]|nr:MAG: WYL domain-containing protein [bacterium]
MSSTEINKVERLLKLLIWLSSGRWYRLQELGERLKLSERSVYRYIAAMRSAGLIVEIGDSGYRIPKIGGRIKELSDLLHFSEEEAMILKEAIHAVDDNNELKANLIRKLYSLYDFDRVADTVVHPDRLPVIHNLLKAIREKRQVVIRDYHSSHGNLIRDRLVEPFDLTVNYSCVWVFDPESRKNKVFRTSRIRSVDLTDNLWQFTEQHEIEPCDVFRVYGKQKFPVKLRLSLTAYNLLIEEFPLSGSFIRKVNDQEYLYDGWVTSWDGIGRFVMGLSGEVEVISPKAFKTFLLGKAEGFINKNGG